MATLARNERELMEAMKTLVEMAYRKGLQLIKKKCKVLRVGGAKKEEAKLYVHTSLGYGI